MTTSEARAADRESLWSRRGCCWSAQTHHAIGTCSRALRYARRVRRGDGSGSCARSTSRRDCWRRASASRWRPAHMGARYREWVENLQLGLVHLAPALLRRAVPGLVLRLPVARRSWRMTTSCRWTRPRRQPTDAVRVRRHDASRRRRDVMDTWATSSHVAADRRAVTSTDPELYAAGVPVHAAATGARDHPHLGVLHHPQVAPPVRRAAVDGRGDLWLGAGAARAWARSARAVAAGRWRRWR